MPDLHVLAMDPEDGSTPTAVVVAMHGLGATAEDLAGVAGMLGLPGVRWVFPQGWMPVHHAFGQGWAWFDLPPNHRAGVLESRRRLLALLDEIVTAGTPSERIVVTGFSQGGVMTLDAGLRYPRRLAGLAPLSGYLFDPETLPTEMAPAQAGTPVFVAHGTFDDVVPIAGSRQATEALRRAGLAVDFREYPMAHQITPEVARDLRAFLTRVLGVRSCI